MNRATMMMEIPSTRPPNPFANPPHIPESSADAPTNCQSLSCPVCLIESMNLGASEIGLVFLPNL
jgi:hypothetical protein